MGTIFWAVSLRAVPLSKGIVIYTLLNLILTVMAGMFLFNEQLALTHKIGILMGIASIILMEI